MSNEYEPKKTSSESVTLSPKLLFEKKYSSVQSLFLGRINRIAELKKRYSGKLPPTDWRIRLINRSLYSTFVDCQGQNMQDEASQTLELVRKPTR